MIPTLCALVRCVLRAFEVQTPITVWRHLCGVTCAVDCQVASASQESLDGAQRSEQNQGLAPSHMVESAQKASSFVIGRYVLHAQIAFGGTATIHLGRLLGPIGFSRTVAIKRLHGSFGSDPTFVGMFMDEARLAARLRHPNVVSIIDVIAENGELLLVMDYVHGESFAGLLAAASNREMRAEPQVTIKIMSDALAGLHAAHELGNEEGAPLRVVHRDFSPQNILVGADGVGHLIDFGIAKAVGRVQHTKEGQIKGKLRYMAPEQIEGGVVDRRTDIFAAAGVLWEALVGRFLFAGTEAQLLHSVLTAPIPSPRSLVPQLPKALDAVVMKGLERNPHKRFATALEMSEAMEAALRPATSRAVGRWVRDLAAEGLAQRARLVHAIEREDYSSAPTRGQRESGSVPSDVGAVNHNVAFCAARSSPSMLDEQGTSGLKRYTLPLPIQSPAPQLTSAVHYREARTWFQWPPRRHWQWMVGIVAVTLGCMAALWVLSRVRRQAPERIPHAIATASSASPSTEQVPANSLDSAQAAPAVLPEPAATLSGPDTEQPAESEFGSRLEPKPAKASHNRARLAPFKRRRYLPKNP